MRLCFGGARGVAIKDMSPDALLHVIRRVAAGELWIDRATSGRILGRQCGRALQADTGKARYDSLTAKEREVVMKVVDASGASNRELAAMLFISEHTLRNHLSAIYQKLGVDNRLKLYVYAVKHGVVKP